jgi:membrane protease YdiL (CAAX protease family)
MAAKQLWLRIPALLRAVIVGLAVVSLGTVPWATLASMNIKHWPDVPWSVPVMALVLVAWWKYFVRGRGWPAATAERRRLDARANPVPDHLWGVALGAGILGLVSVLLLQGVLARLVPLPQQQELDPSKFPLGTVVAWVIMSAFVAGVVEETAFRGYMQRGIEQRHGPLVAILVTGSVFGLLHFTHPEVGIVLLPYYIAVAAVYGGLAYATNSTLPSMVLHTGGNIFSAFSLFTQGRSEWQLGIRPPRLVWQSGVDASFVLNVVAFLATGFGTVLAYRALVSAGRAARLQAN